MKKAFKLWTNLAMFLLLISVVMLPIGIIGKVRIQNNNQDVLAAQDTRTNLLELELENKTTNIKKLESQILVLEKLLEVKESTQSTTSKSTK